MPIVKQHLKVANVHLEKELHSFEVLQSQPKSVLCPRFIYYTNRLTCIHTRVRLRNLHDCIIIQIYKFTGQNFLTRLPFIPFWYFSALLLCLLEIHKKIIWYRFKKKRQKNLLLSVYMYVDLVPKNIKKKFQKAFSFSKYAVRECYTSNIAL